MSKNQIEQVILDVANSRYLGYSFIFFHGSRARNTARDDSDLDVIVVYEKKTRPYREVFVASGYTFDAFIYDAEAIHSELLASKKVCQTSMLHILKTSKVLPQPTPISAFLIELAEQISPLPCETRNLEPTRLFLTNLLGDFSRADDESVQISLGVELYKFLTEIVLFQHGVGGAFRKYTPAILNELDPAFQLTLNSAFLTAMSKQGNSALLDIGRVVLDNIGGELRDNFKFPMPDRPRTPIKLTPS